MTGGNRNDITQPIPLLQAVHRRYGVNAAGHGGPDVVMGDRGYGYGYGYGYGKYRHLVGDLG